MKRALGLLLLLLGALSATIGARTEPGRLVCGPDGSQFVAGQIIIRLKDDLRSQVIVSVGTGSVRTGVAGLDELNSRWGVREWRRLIPLQSLARHQSWPVLYRLTMPENVDVDAAAADFARSPLADYACPNGVLKLHGVRDETPNDPRFPDQWYLTKIRAPSAWTTAHGDSAVTIAVVDEGLLWTHEDIEPNLRINTPEDINGNGRFDSLPPPAGDLDGIDQDGNGYVDDVIGYDFVDRDPNPMSGPSDDHGTMCWGISNAVTNNAVGIAAPSWNCRGMALRCGSGGNLNLDAVVSAIYYALDKGAWVFSLSFGTNLSYPPLADACSSIWEAGALSVASSGGGSDSNPVYPAAYPLVIAVTASDQSDHHAAFAGYAHWVDVCAPGVQILATSPSGYSYYSGTSCSAPIVAGILAWLKSAHPELTNDSARTLLYNWCDSMPDPLYPQGLLGHGRVAMTESSLTGVEVSTTQDAGRTIPAPTVVRGVLEISRQLTANNLLLGLYDAGGRHVMPLRIGANDVSRLGPGVYFVRVSASEAKPTKVVITR